MKLKEKESKVYPIFKTKSKIILKKIFNKKTRIILIVLFILGIFLIGNLFGLLVTGFFGTLENPSKTALNVLHKFEFHNLRNNKIIIDGILAENIKIPFNYLIGQFSKPRKIFIDIAFEDYQRIEYKREEALERNFLVTSGEDYVPGKITYGDKTIDIRLRLKGDGVDHLNGDKWSFRIKVKGDNTFLGMKVFSIQNPKTRNYLDEFVYHQALKRDGIIGLRYEFVEVIINGKNKGIYALEEHFDKQLIEDNQKRGGVIIKFDETVMSDEGLRIKDYFEGNNFIGIHHDPDWWFYGGDIETFNNDKILSDPVLSEQYKKAKDLLELFRNGTLKTHEVFDVDILSRYFAINTILRAAHASAWNNIRFYYNPLTSHLEPIGYDAGPNRDELDDILEWYIPDYFGAEPSKTKTFWDLIFEDEVFFKKYMEEIEKISNKPYLDELFAELDKGIKQNTRILHKDNPFYHFPRETYYESQRKLEFKLNPVKNMNSYFHESVSMENKVVMYLGNLDFFPLEILGLTYNDSAEFRLIQLNKIVKQKTSSGAINYQKFEFSIPPNLVWEDSMASGLKIRYKLWGLEKEFSEEILPWPYVQEDLLETDFFRKESNTNFSEMFEINEGMGIIFIKPGIWTLDKEIILPKGFKILSDGKTTINLINSATILSYSPLNFIGSENNPIQIISSDKTGQGIVVLNAGEESNFKHVIFENLRNPSKEGWEPSGAITFYKSPFKFENVKISNMLAEDSLDIVNSKYEIRNSIFEGCFSDCIDDDFGGGLIESTSFSDCGNDCIDISGSSVELKNIIITNVGDKGISIGEKGEVKMENIEINGGYIGVAGKDLSKTNIDKIKISDCEYGFSVYEKKSEFGPAKISVTNVELYSNKKDYLVEKGSTLLIDEKIILGNKEKVYEILYPLDK